MIKTQDDILLSVT